MAELRLCIDVDGLQRAVDFYTQALGLRVGRRRGDSWAELLGASVPIDLLAQAAGTAPLPGKGAVREYTRHWTPVHFDVVVPELEAAMARARSAGATLEREVQNRVWGRMANLADPFGHGFCLVELRGKGYDEVPP